MAHTTTRSTSQLFYLLRIEVGLIAALAILVVASKISWSTGNQKFYTVSEREVIWVTDVPQTKLGKKMPALPPRPLLPVAAAEEISLPEDELRFDAYLDVKMPLAYSLPIKLPTVTKLEGLIMDPEFYYIVEEMPQIIGGLKSIRGRVRYPRIAIRAGIEGRVFLQFVVDIRGEVSDIRVIRGIGWGCDEAAIQALSGTAFTPGRQHGKPVPVKMAIPFHFRIIW